jgi:hypothetical protein
MGEVFEAMESRRENRKRWIDKGFKEAWMSAAWSELSLQQVKSPRILHCVQKLLPPPEYTNPSVKARANRPWTNPQGRGVQTYNNAHLGHSIQGKVLKGSLSVKISSSLISK